VTNGRRSRLPNGASVPGVFWERVTMVAGSGKSIFNRGGIGPTISIAGVLFVTSPHAQIQRDIDRCAGKDLALPELQIRSCTGLIESKVYTGKAVTFAFNRRDAGRAPAGRISNSGDQETNGVPNRQKKPGFPHTASVIENTRTCSHRRPR
jgi:hypothetical protein